VEVEVEEEEEVVVVVVAMVLLLVKTSKFNMTGITSISRHILH